MAEDSKQAKRRVKNPETFRERAIKATEAEETPKRAHRVAGPIGRFIKAIFRPIGAGLKKFFGLRIFKPLRKPARILGKILFPAYFRNSWKELKQVEWPGWKESRSLTLAVLMFAIVFGATIAIVDYGLDKAFKDFLLK